MFHVLFQCQNCHNQILQEAHVVTLILGTDMPSQESAVYQELSRAACVNQVRMSGNMIIYHQCLQSRTEVL